MKRVIGIETEREIERERERERERGRGSTESVMKHIEILKKIRIRKTRNLPKLELVRS